MWIEIQNHHDKAEYSKMPMVVDDDRQNLALDIVEMDVT